MNDNGIAIDGTTYTPQQIRAAESLTWEGWIGESPDGTTLALVAGETETLYHIAPDGTSWEVSS